MDACLLVGLEDEVLAGEQSLDYHIVDARPKKIHVNVDLLQMLAEAGETPFEAVVIVL
jgi:hypothetical protein